MKNGVFWTNFEMDFLAILLLQLIITTFFQSITQAKVSHQNFKINDGSDWSTEDVTRDLHHEHQLVRPRRSMVSTAVQPCYKSFVASNQPPSGFRKNHNNIRYICQQLPGKAVNYYSTMFDMNYGIPIYSAYVVSKGQASQFNKAKRPQVGWRQESPGITHQASDETYKKQSTYHKGHLLPAETYSFTADHILSTFTYTNAVPQKSDFNTGQWLQYEKNIRNYATTTCSTKGGDLYLITGISEARIDKEERGVLKAVQVILEKLKPNNDKISIPRSMWTAGCCIVPSKGAVGAFAVIGNNLNDDKKINMSEVKITELQDFLLTGVQGFGGKAISLFPGNPGCSNPVNQVNFRKRPAPSK